MCGIFGVMMKEEVPGEVVQEATALMRSYGPDDEGYAAFNPVRSFWGSSTDARVIEEEGGFFPEEELSGGAESCVWLANRRLRITGNYRSHQPMKAGPLWITFEGELYNYRELRRRLEEREHSFETDGDTEVFLRAFAEWGVQSLRRMRGMWAAGIYDVERERLVCLTDRFAQVPLYYHVSDEGVCFSSTIRSLLSLPWVYVKPAEEEVMDYLKYGLTDHRENTLFEGIRRLVGGQHAVYDGEEFETGRYWELEGRPDLSLQEAVREAVKMRMEDEAAVLTSSGIDSSSIAFESRDRKPMLFNASFVGKPFDEWEEMKDMGERAGLRTERIRIQGGDILREVKETIRDQEEPAPSFLYPALSMLFRSVKENGHKVAFNGSGPDEFACGYPEFVDYHIAHLLRQGKVILALRYLYTYRDSFSFTHFASVILPDGLKQLTKHIIPEKVFSDVDPTYLCSPDGYGRPAVLEAADSLQEAMKKKLFYRGLPRVLRCMNKSSKSFSVEARAAFLDKEVAEAAFGVDESDYFSLACLKPLFRRVFDGRLPDTILHRSKMGWGHMGEDWYEDDGVREIFRSTFSSESFLSREHLNSHVILEAFKNGELTFMEAYRFYVYEMWMRQFFDRSAEDGSYVD